MAYNYNDLAHRYQYVQLWQGVSPDLPPVFMGLPYPQTPADWSDDDFRRARVAQGLPTDDLPHEVDGAGPDAPPPVTPTPSPSPSPSPTPADRIPLGVKILELVPRGYVAIGDTVTPPPELAPSQCPNGFVAACQLPPNVTYAGVAANADTHPNAAGQAYLIAFSDTAGDLTGAVTINSGTDTFGAPGGIADGLTKAYMNVFPLGEPSGVLATCQVQT